jgi:hypothetical protein
MFMLAALLATNLNLASSLIASGGGPGSYSTVRAFSGMVGQDAVLADQRQLAGANGQDAANRFVPMFDYAIADAWQLAGKYNVSMPQTPTGPGTPALAAQLVQAGESPGGSFDSGTFFAQLFGDKIAEQMFQDLDAKFGSGSSTAFARMTTQFFTNLHV